MQDIRNSSRKKEAKKRIALFAHFDLHDIIDEYVLYYLKNLREYADSIVFISTSNLPSLEKSKVNIFCEKIIVRDNVGYDFLSWKIGLGQIPDLSYYDELILCNDSVYGPIFPLKEVFDTQLESKADFWGITDCSAVKYHIQSYFIAFKRNVFLSETFRKFITNITIEKNKDDVINKYEIELTQELLKNGYSAKAYIPEIKSIRKLIFTRIQQIKNRSFKRLKKDLKEKKMFSRKRWNPANINRAHLYWKDLIIKYRMPFIKVELFRENPATVNIGNYKNLLDTYSCYEPSLMENHLKRLKKASTAND
jgi:lipopolysaccharide biosynthesis protein